MWKKSPGRIVARYNLSVWHEVFVARKDLVMVAVLQDGKSGRHAIGSNEKTFTT